jgi:hypothetical protein
MKKHIFKVLALPLLLVVLNIRCNFCSLFQEQERTSARWLRYAVTELVKTESSCWRSLLILTSASAGRSGHELTLGYN